MDHRSKAEIFKYDHIYSTYADTYGQTEEEEPRFKVSMYYLNAIRNARTVFEAGVGKGGFYRMAQRSYQCEGIEPSAVAMKHFHADDPTVKNIFAQEVPDHYAPDSFDVVVCLDVLEHIPAEDIDAVFESLCFAGKRYFIFSIANHDDVWDGMQLHVNQMPYEEWQERLERYFSIVHWTPTHQDLARIYLLEKKAPASSELQFDPAKVPLVSVVVPSYNQASWLPMTLDSIIDQTYPFWEAVVVNDGSTDATAEVIAQYEAKDARIRGVHKVNGGISSALNAGIDAARGEYFCWLSSDDLFHPEKLELQIAALPRCDERTGIIFGPFDHVDPQGAVTVLEHTKPHIDGMEFPQFLKYDYIDGTTVMIPMALLRSLGGFNVQFKHAQDTELWFRFAAKGHTFHYIDRKLSCRRIHPSQGFTDFEMDCRFDGFWMVDFYLTHYSFREFYRHVDFNDDDGLHSFIKQFYAMLLDPNCNVNHAVIFRKFWSWFTYGLKTLPIAVRSRIINHGKYVFTETRQQGFFFESYLHRFEELERAIGTVKPVSFQIRDQFHDITAFDTAADGAFADMVFEFGLHQRAIGGMNLARSAFKYLSDRPNKRFDEAFASFFDLTFARGDFDAYARSFKRKPDLASMPDAVLGSYAFALAALGRSDAEVLRVADLIKTPAVRSNIDRFRAGSYGEIDTLSILHWNFAVQEFSILHTVSVRCPDCLETFAAHMPFALGPSASATTIACSHCCAPFRISDAMMTPYFTLRNSFTSHRSGSGAPRVAVVMRYSNIIGGGVKKMLQHAEWLETLGCSVTVYSDAPAPTWRKVPGTFVRVQDHYDVPADKHDAVVCMCIYDVPKMLTKYPVERVALFCQGYEGYHLGRTYEELRADKFFYTALHALPAAKIVASNHLADHFRRLVGQESLVVPNGIDHAVYHPDLSVRKEPMSLLFIGNPNDPLKGLVFLTTTLEELQKSDMKLPGLTLHVVFGGVGKKETKHIPMAGYDVQYHEGLSGADVASLVNRVELVVNTSWYEGFSLPVLEAMACGTPVVTTNNMGAESFTTDGVNGHVVRYGDMNRLGNIILDVLTHRAEVNAMVLGGLETAQEYSEASSMRKFITAYGTFLGVPFPEKRQERLLRETVHGGGALPLIIRPEEGAPLFTVLVPTYNHARFLPESLGSLLRQTCTQWEAVIVNDGSTDDTRAVLDRFALFDQRFKVFHKENGGVSTALNEALKHARGEWICWLSSDDMFEPEKLETHRKQFAQTPEVKFYHTMYHGLDHRTGRKVALGQQSAKYMPPVQDQVISFFYTNFVNGISICAHRSVFERVGGFDTKFRSGQDFDMWLRIAEQFPFRFLAAKTCTYRVHPDQGASAFPEAGEYDSAIACAAFLNAHPFERLFPWSDLTTKEQLVPLIQKIITIANDPVAFVNRLDFGHLLVDRFHEWLVQKCPPALRAEISAAMAPVVRDVTLSAASERLKESYRALEFADAADFSYRPVDLPTATHHALLAKIAVAAPAEAATLRKYMDRLEAMFHPPVPVMPAISTVTSMIEQQRFKEALIALSHIESPALVEQVWNLCGDCYLGLEDLRHAKECYESALQHNNNSSAACAGLGEVFYQAEMDTEAKTMFEWSIRSDATNIAARKGLAKVNRALHTAPSHNSLNDPSIAERVEEAEALIGAGVLERAHALLMDAVEHDPYHLDILNDLAVCSLLQEHGEEAAELLDLVLTIDPENETALENIGALRKDSETAGTDRTQEA